MENIKTLKAGDVIISNSGNQWYLVLKAKLLIGGVQVIELAHSGVIGNFTYFPQDPYEIYKS
jgi:hypothetical protein